jgi:hypothetical protein
MRWILAEFVLLSYNYRPVRDGRLPEGVSMRACRRGLHVCLPSNRFGVLKRTSFHEDNRAGHDKQEGLYRSISSF